MNEFAELESRLASLSPDQSPVMRDRILHAVNEELGASHQTAWDAPAWSLAAAAVLLAILLNISFASAARDAFLLSRHGPDQAATEMQALASIEASSFRWPAFPAHQQSKELNQ